MSRCILMNYTKKYYEVVLLSKIGYSSVSNGNIRISSSVSSALKDNLTSSKIFLLLEVEILWGKPKIILLMILQTVLEGHWFYFPGLMIVAASSPDKASLPLDSDYIPYTDLEVMDAPYKICASFAYIGTFLTLIILCLIGWLIDWLIDSFIH